MGGGRWKGMWKEGVMGCREGIGMRCSIIARDVLDSLGTKDIPPVQSRHSILTTSPFWMVPQEGTVSL